MPIFAVSLLYHCQVAGAVEQDPMRELTIRVVSAADEAAAFAKGAELGLENELAYPNMDGEKVSWSFQRVVECQHLFKHELTDGMEVSSWLYRGEGLCLNDGWLAPARPRSNDDGCSIYSEVQGGLELLNWFGREPSFHDAEVLDLQLRRTGRSTLRIHGWINTGGVGADGAYILDRHAIVTFTLEGIMDLQLDGFSSQNVIGGLTLRRAPDRADRHRHLSDPSPDDIEIELEPCYGLDGLIRARSVAITFEPGVPAESNV